MKMAIGLLALPSLLCGCVGPVHKTDAPPFIYVHGEFNNPGQYTWTNGMTIMDAISAAGGFTDFAHERIRLVHSDGSSQFFKWSATHPLTNTIVLRPGDSVVNPRQ
jgi:protein involved in polysaccharide export with SLBB domain